MFEKADPTLRNLVPFVKEVTISILSIPDYDPEVPPVLHEHVMIRLLKAFAERVAIRKLSFVANLGDAWPYFALDWMSFASDIQEVFKSLLQLPSVSSLCLRDVMNLPASLLEMANPRLHTLEVMRCLYM